MEWWPPECDTFEGSWRWVGTLTKYVVVTVSRDENQCAEGSTEREKVLFIPYNINAMVLYQEGCRSPTSSSAWTVINEKGPCGRSLLFFESISPIVG